MFAEFERNLDPFKQVVLEVIGGVASERMCTHRLPHDGVTLPIELP